MKIKIGMDVEFMAFKGKNMVYARGPGSPTELQRIGCDEFGHCIEVRPKEAEDEYELIGNIMREMSGLPKEFSYKTLNAVEVPEKDHIALVRRQGRKQVPECKNVYNVDILKTTGLEKMAIQKNQKVLYCGMHVHVSTALGHSYEGKHKRKSENVDIPVPAVLLTQLFDDLIFTSMEGDPSFNCGRYRQRGFYEMKTSSHFEYRSLGSSAFTPERVAIIFRMVKHIVENHDVLSVLLNGNWDFVPKDKMALADLRKNLRATKPYDEDLLKIWGV